MFTMTFLSEICIDYLKGTSVIVPRIRFKIHWAVHFDFCQNPSNEKSLVVGFYVGVLLEHLVQLLLRSVQVKIYISVCRT
jgi:hypothetical protein